MIHTLAEWTCRALAWFFALAIPFYILAPFLPSSLGGGSRKSVIRDDNIGFDK